MTHITVSDSDIFAFMSSFAELDCQSTREQVCIVRVRAVQDFENELEVVEAGVPVVVGVTSELNEPRLPPLTAILKAASEPVHEWSAHDLGVSPDEVGAESSLLEELSNLAPEQDRKGVLYEDADEGVVGVLKALHQEGVLD